MEPSPKDVSINIISVPMKHDEELNISNFPQEPSWKVSQNLYKYQNFWYYEFALKVILLFQKKFIPQPDDIFLATTPKSGTTWLKALAFAIHTRTRYINGGSDDDDHKSPLLSKMPHAVVPFIEFICAHNLERDLGNPLLSTHVPFRSLPYSILNSDSKIIYLCRDPKDVLVSQYEFTSKHGDAEIVPFEEVFEKFCNGFSNCGPFWDHVLGYWNASLEFPERVLFLKYEELKNDTAFDVKKIADFIGCPFSVEEEEQGIVEKIVQFCSFDNLSNLDVNKSTTKIYNSFAFGNEAYFRKGKVGDWKNYFTSEMGKRIDQITADKFSGSGLHF
ncbi:Cytosolic sulfotransferase 17 [Euphorbia peplus]|nr:Cytosolic sulfotransferase 17 [Euphorbia peplus]